MSDELDESRRQNADQLAAGADLASSPPPSNIIQPAAELSEVNDPPSMPVPSFDSPLATSIDDGSEFGPSTATIAQSEDQLLSWQASEFIDHQKNASWFVLLVLGAAAACLATYFLTSRNIISTVAVAMASLAFGLVAGKKPRTLDYSLFPTNLRVGERTYHYEDFRAFSIHEDGAASSIVLAPNKRFMPILSIFFDPNDGERIFDVLATHLPYEPHKNDIVDNIMRRINF